MNLPIITPPSPAADPRLEPPEGRRYWRSLESAAETEAFRTALAREFPEQAVTWDDEPSRRAFLKVMGASLALAGLQGCSGEPAEKIVPYVRTPDGAVPGRATYYATAATLDGFATGVLAESHDGRPTKIDGNPDHPASLGGSDPFLQAEVLGLYDPDRSQAVTTGGAITGWPAFLEDLASQLATQVGRQGQGLRIVSHPISSPTLLAQREKLLEAYPEAKWIEYSAVDRSGVRAGTERLFGRPLEPRYDFSRADVVLSLDADPFATLPDHLRMTREYAGRRRAEVDGQPWMTRHYAVETTFTLFGAAADHRRPVKPSDIVAVVRAIARKVGVDLPGGAESLPEGIDEAFVTAVATDLKSYRRPGEEAGGPLVVVGETQPAEVHALAHAMNVALGAVGATVAFHPPITGAAGFEPLRELAEAMRAGDVDAMLVIGANPVYDAPADLAFGEALETKAADDTPRIWRAAYGLYANETSVACNWQLPATHFLEEWSDARTLDGTATIVQPLIRPLYDGRSVHELLSAIIEESPRTGYEIVREQWQADLGKDGFEDTWRKSLDAGLIEGTASDAVDVAIAGNALENSSPIVPAGSGFEIVFRPDANVYDGRFANSGWLQELPRPFTTLTWDNAALLAPADAERLGLADGDLVTVTLGERSIELPALRLPGQSEGTLALHLGFGRTRSGRVGNDVGTDVGRLRTSESPWFAAGAEVRRATGSRRLAVTQLHHLLVTAEPGSFVSKSTESRHVIREGTLAELLEHPDDPAFMHVGHHGPVEHAQPAHDPAEGDAPEGDAPTHAAADHAGDDQPSFYPIEKAEEYEPNEWGMAIDLTRCIGCNACTIACQSENNIPVVGREQVLVGREMHWIRVDTYFEGDVANPGVAHQPVPCMHCEHAPCEPVCPVAATTHSDEGLNEMTYNRCIGTRYCSNNCPYKVRRFNFLEYHQNYTADELPVLNLLPNPDVTVRSRGVMEKCTYCVQRISEARIDAQIEGRPVIDDGEVITACQQACPAEAIVFGNIADAESKVTQAKASPLDYVLLEELNTRPRTSYGAMTRNPNPEL